VDVASVLSQDQVEHRTLSHAGVAGVPATLADLGTTATAANLNALTGGGETALHSHAGGGGAGGVLRSATVTLNHAGILVLPSTPKPLVAAPGGGRRLLFHQLIVRTVAVVDPGTEPYDGTADGDGVQIVYAGSGSQLDGGFWRDDAQSVASLALLLAGNPSVAAWRTWPLWATLASGYQAPDNLLDDLTGANLPLIWSWLGSSGPLTGGHVDDVWYLTTLYSILNTTTGAVVTD
jgi:hypothetical protein